MEPEIMDNNTYFAAADTDEIIDELRNKITEYYSDLSAEGIMDLIQRLHKAYYGADLSQNAYEGLFASSKIKEEDRLGFLKKYKANHFRNVIRHILQLATSQRIGFQPRAVNSDYKSLTQAALAKGILEYYLREQKLEKKFKDTLEKALIFLEGWIHTPWDETAGGLYDEVVNEETGEGEEIYRGDLRVDTYTMLDVVRDISSEFEDHKWLMVRTIENKWDLAATYKEVAEEILDTDMVDQSLAGYESFRENLKSTQESPDQLICWVFYHRPTPALPNGRILKFCGDTVLLDAPFPYQNIPLFCVKSSNIIGTPYGYSDAADLLGPQKALDILNTQRATNQFNLGIQSVWAKSGETPNIKTLADGMTLWQSPEKPEKLELASDSKGAADMAANIEMTIEKLSGVNSTVRGNPPGANMSGAAQALLVSQSVAFNSMLEASYTEMVENAATMLIQNIQDFAKTPRIVTILGESNKPFSREFVADDISNITRVVVDTSNPMVRTASGRLELARLMQEMGISLTPYQLLNIIETGSLQSAVEGSQTEYLTIRGENEALRDGQPVKAVFTDNHAEHIKEHKSIIADPESRMNPELVMSVMAHIQEHLDVWRNTDPQILQIIGIQPPPPPPMAPNAGTPPMDPTANPNMPNQPNLPQVPDEAPPEAAQDFDERSMT